MSPHLPLCFTSSLLMTPLMRREFVHKQLEHHTHLDTVTRYDSEDRLDQWDATCDQLVDYYWFLDHLVRSTMPEYS